MKNILIISVLFILSSGYGQSGLPYQIYSDKGKKVSFQKMIKTLAKSDVVLFGEFHNNSLGHWLELEVAKSLYERRDLILGAEMFEADNQEVLTAYVNNEIAEEEMTGKVRLWNNYVTDYRPLVEFSKSKNLRFIATNVPRRYASLVYKEGIEALSSLSSTEKKWIAPVPFPYDESLSGYQKMLTMFDGHGGGNFPRAQAVKDATMAHFISENYESSKLFLHFNGSYHSDNYEGIGWYLNVYSPELDVVTITMVESEDVSILKKEHLGIANFIIVINASILKSF